MANLNIKHPMNTVQVCMFCKYITGDKGPYLIIEAK